MRTSKLSGCCCVFLFLAAFACGNDYTGRVTSVQLTDFFQPLFSDIHIGDEVYGEFYFAGQLQSPNVLYITQNYLTVHIGEHYWEGHGRASLVQNFGDVHSVNLEWDPDSGTGTYFFPYAWLISTISINADDRIGGSGMILRQPFFVNGGTTHEDYRVDFSIDPVTVPEPTSLTLSGVIVMLLQRRRKGF